MAREHASDLLIYTLSHMLWQPDYMPRVQIGLPQMSLDGARLLAHCFLFDIDRFLNSRKDIDFARYMDDIDVGVDDIATAKKLLRDLDLALQTRQLRLNSGKTKILKKSEAMLHFRIEENAGLAAFEEHIETRRKSNRSTKYSRKYLEHYISDNVRSGAFKDGNGDKILKRCINYARIYGIPIENDTFKKKYLWNTFPVAGHYFSGGSITALMTRS